MEMESGSSTREKSRSKNDGFGDISGSDTEFSSAKAKSSQRLRYEAEVEIIKRKLGSLDDIRNQLGLPQRKIAQLLLVDPSAWTRWTKSGEDAPPHIYRMLQWYLALQDKYPALDVGFWLQSVARTAEPEQIARTERRLQELQGSIGLVQSELSKLKDYGIRSKNRAFWAAFGGLALGILIGFGISMLS